MAKADCNHSITATRGSRLMALDETFKRMTAAHHREKTKTAHDACLKQLSVPIPVRKLPCSGNDNRKLRSAKRNEPGCCYRFPSRWGLALDFRTERRDFSLEACLSAKRACQSPFAI